MYYEIRRAGFNNKGALMMLITIIEQMQKQYPNSKPVIAPSDYSAKYEDRIKLELFQKAEFNIKGYDVGRHIFGNLPNIIRKNYGIVKENEICVIFDSAGYRYSDKLSKYATYKLSNEIKRWKKKNCLVILMPQAFGPYDTNLSKESVRLIADNADLIFVRDNVSYKYITEITGDRHNIKLSKDFTNLLTATQPDTKKFRNNVVIVPNERMISTAPDKNSLAYKRMLKSSIKYIQELGLSCFFLIHDNISDKQLALDINSNLDYEIPIIEHDEPRVLKGYISESKFMIGSRYHALISSLSQAVPAIGSSWSHKYNELFAEYCMEEFLLEEPSEKAIKYKIEKMLRNYDSIRNNLKLISQNMKKSL